MLWAQALTVLARYCEVFYREWNSVFFIFIYLFIFKQSCIWRKVCFVFVLVSQGELQLALSLGVKPDKIIYAHTAKPLEHIKYACAHGVNTMTFDCEDELLKISRCTDKAK